MLTVKSHNSHVFFAKNKLSSDNFIHYLRKFPISEILLSICRAIEYKIFTRLTVRKLDLYYSKINKSASDSMDKMNLLGELECSNHIASQPDDEASDEINMNQQLEEQNQLDINISTGSSTDSISPGRIFRRIPELGRCYERGGWDKQRRAIHTCIGCGSPCNSSDSRRLAKHTINCDKLPDDIRDIIKAKYDNMPFISKSEDSKIYDSQNLLFLRVMVRKNVSFALLDDKLFKQFLENYCKDVKLVSRHVMAEKYLPYEANSVSNRMSDLVQAENDYFLSIEFDHLTDYSHRSILAIIATTSNGARILVSLEDVSLLGKSAEAIVEPLKNRLKEFPRTKINSIISDSASSCKLAREQLTEEPEFKHIIQHRCLAHLLNSVGENFSEKPVMRTMIEVATKLSTFVNNRTKLSAQLKERGYNRVQKATKTRWYSLVNMLESLVAVKDELVQLIEDSNELETRELLGEIVFLHEMSSAIRILRPLANCIAIAERVDGSVGQTFKAILEFYKSLISMNWEHEIVAGAINSFLTYFNSRKLQGDFSLMIAAYCLDRKNKMDYLTEVAIKKTFLQIRIIAKKSGYSNAALKLLSDNFASFCRQENEYSRIHKDGQSSIDWWKSVPRRGILKDIAIRLANLKSSSANCERTFSEIKQAQCPNRSNYSIETLKNLMVVKLSANQELEDQEDADFTRYPGSQPPILVPTRSRRRQPNTSSAQIHVLQEDQERIENCSQMSSVSTLATFSQGDSSVNPPLERLQIENLIAYKELKELFDFRLVREFRTNADEEDDETDQDDDEALEGFLKQLNS